ncbi:hypothetical protein NUV89_04305 [Pseudomonas sp. 18.1.10]|uniref:hypothetical protein n=1 Tax=Pseudomonas sp. 18.1.10 TaxID=2969302 RepID=UPI00214FC023|nr:hypothetical protein [Pseudomonas sp. 18.1.10]MCR4537614.1 hypothetical protein [Pseudomonas sp. 18.1.10]
MNRPDSHRDFDYRPDRRRSDARRDWDYRPDRGFPDARRDWDYRPDRGFPDARSDWDCRPDRGFPDARRDWDYHPDRGFPDVRRDWEMRPDFTPSPPQANTTVGALRQLLDSMPDQLVQTDRGITANDIRAGKFGTLSPEALKELEKLDKNQDYRLVTLDSPSGTASAWITANSDTPVFIQAMASEGPVTLDRMHPLWRLPKIMSAPIKFINEGITTDALKAGKHGPLHPEIKKSLEALKQDKSYTLTSFPKHNENDDTLLAWVEKGSGNIVPIGTEDGRPS